MRHGSLFSGLGGFDLAASWVGWENSFHSDIDPFCLTILKHHFPNATTYSDIRNTDFTSWLNRIDVLSGGFPCPPFSQAGKRKGTADDRYLWPEMYRAVQQIRPRWVVAENVLGIVNWNGGLVFEQVHLDLEAAGYSVQTFVLPACGINAPHQRYRTWFVAHRNDDQLRSGLSFEEWCRSTFAPYGSVAANTDPDSDREQGVGGAPKTQGDEEKFRSGNNPAGESGGTDLFGNERWNPYGYVSYTSGTGSWTVTDTELYGYEVRSKSGGEDESAQDGHDILLRSARSGTQWDATDPRGFRPENLSSEGDGQDDNTRERRDIHGRTEDACAQRLASDAYGKMLQCGDHEGAQRWDLASFGAESSGGSFCWEGFPTVAPVLRGDDGFSEILHGISFPRWRKESIKAYGNAIVPQLAYRIFRVIDYMSNGR